ncbi:adenylate kinase [Rhizobium sp. RM]|uniref:ATP-binding protein n=1 Tax=Rhizobium sp. RM TaxID=2748079 RepID=UPI00110DFAAB|nr:adenylate kinase [Rhizobium sp. RM]NWJ25873.1 adenylate kinase [Rhizobium sp. RM]TMV15844.1 adenylate kinase [Rhizobium sp. Td3]
MTTLPRIHITGASCCGVSTLGAALSQRFSVPQLDVDDFYWMPTDPPFTTKRPPQDRVRQMQEQQAALAGWILTGSCMVWGDALMDNIDLIIFLHTPTPTRLQRLDARESERHGTRILPGGDMHETHQAFRDWASRYDDPSFTGRNLAQHERWLSKQTKPTLRLQGEEPTEDLVHKVEDELLRHSLHQNAE